MKNDLMKYKDYRAQIHYDDENKIFWGEVIGINDTIAFHADNVKTLEQHFHDRVEDYLEMCRENGKEPDKEYSGSFSVRVEPNEQRKAVLCAAAMNISLNQYYGKALEAFNQINSVLIV